MLDFDQLNERMRDLSPVVQAINDEQVTALYRFLNERIAYPENFVVMLGETSSGKTSIINGLMKNNLLPVSASPTTGTVVEIMDDSDLTEPEYYGLQRNATLEQVSAQTFTALCGKPKQHHSRLRLIIPAFPKGLTGLRLFDTPGYGSLHEEHDEVLKEFIPNSDLVIYVVSYRVGFQAGDYEFLQYIGELLDDTTEFVLVINRISGQAAAEDHRIQEIQGYTSDCLHRQPACFLVESAAIGEDGEKVFVEAPALWAHVSGVLKSEERQGALYRALTSYQYDFAMTLKTWLEKELLYYKTSQAEQAAFSQEIKDLAAVEKEIHDLICITFGQLANRVEGLFEHAAAKVSAVIKDEIYSAGKWTQQEECAAFIQHHLLPLEVRIQGREVAAYFQTELEALDEKIDNMLNGALQKFNTNVEIHAPLFAPLVYSVGKKLANNCADAGLQAFFRQFGGKGGAGAGVANAAKKGLKKLGELIGKKFSRDTHNAIAAFLKKIGATSKQAVSGAATVIVEALFYIYDANTWQGKLAEGMEKAVDNWAQEAIAGVRKDLVGLREHNVKQVKELLSNYSTLTFEQNCHMPVMAESELQDCLNKVQENIFKLERELEG